MSKQPDVRNQQNVQVDVQAIPHVDNGSNSKKKGAPVHTTKSRLRALALGVCLLVTLALGGIAARAAETIDNDTLTVTRGGDDFSEAVKADYLKTVVTVDLYQIADATPNPQYDIYDYTATLAGLNLDDASLKDDTGVTDWEKVAQAAKKLVEDNKISPTKTGTIAADAASGDITPLNDGLYLVLPQPVKGQSFEFTFNPSVTALPSKGADEDGKIMTSFDYGEWLSEVTINLKPDYLPIYGAIEITKTVNEASAEDSSFVFHITGTTPQGEEYDNYAMVNIPAGELTGKVVVDHIPAGTKLTVVEDYSGRYKKGEVKVEDSDIVVADNADGSHNLIHFSCYNEKGDDTPGSHGVQNNFKYDNVGGDWTWTPAPEDRATNYGPSEKE